MSSRVSVYVVCSLSLTHSVDSTCQLAISTTQARPQAQPAVTALAAQEAAAIEVLTAQGSTVAAAQHLNAAQLPELPQQQQQQQQESTAVPVAAAVPAAAAAAVQQQALSAAEQLKAQQAREQELRNSRFLQQKAELTAQIRAAAERVNT
jgi:hypothetical protein